MSTNITSTQLDFNTIKEELKTHFLASAEFADYDFEASGLSNILDVLAYNTHYNGLVANFALNESFLSTAQLRSSALAISETLGYNPRSKTAASAIVNLSVSVTDPSRPSSITLPSGTTFTTTVDDVSYIFRTLEDYIGSDNGSGLYTFLTNTGSTSLPIYEGVFKTKTFVSDTAGESIYIIPDESVDTSTATVKVFATRNSELFETYLPLDNALEITSNSTYYSLRESSNGYFKLIFGDGVTTGKTPAVGEIIQVTYLSTNAAVANGAKSFIPQNEITVNDIDYTVNVTLVSPASGGGDKETLSSIKTNAPITFSAQNRLVTAQDYIGLINRNYGTFLDDVTAWGGEDNIPASFGDVYVALKYKEGIPEEVKKTVEDSIVSTLSDNLSIMSIDTKFADTLTTYIETQTFFNFNPALVSNTLNTTEGQVRDVVSQYFTDNLNKFNSIFRRSQILSSVDNLSPAVLDSRMDVKVQMRFEPILSKASNYVIQYPVELAAPNSLMYTITSSPLVVNGKTCTIRNKLGSTSLEVVSTNGDVVITSIGSYSPANGTINIVSLKPTSILAAVNYIKMSAVPSNQSTIKPLRNYVLVQDSVNSFASATVDYQDIKATL